MVVTKTKLANLIQNSNINNERSYLSRLDDIISQMSLMLMLIS